ncbi:MAG: hypothetical protein ACM3ML_38835 [Micromonosporaceae bacterium]
MSSRQWSDDELLRELGAALKELAVPENVIMAGEAAFTWRTMESEIELLALADLSELAGDGALVRGSPAGTPRTMAFHGDRLSVEIEIDDGGIIGQLTPPGPGQVTLMTASGQQLVTQADEVGCFSFPLSPPGPLRLECALGEDRFMTDWVAT